ncbi:helix-turn-helix domain-containing protein [Nocardioides sp. NPDC051685]|uniref:AraC-like ligand-binding domain-containing protein n=1 Tax=Nocardioides sp. NPDC051685 TaxID=3364334 RepID=UPI003795601D
MPTQQQVTIDTHLVPTGEQADYWRDNVCDSFVPLRVRPACDDISGRISGFSLAETHMRRIRAVGHEFERRPADIRRNDPEVLHLIVLNRGMTQVEQDGRTAMLRPGDLLFYDSSRPFRFTTPDPLDYTIALLPKRLLPIPDQGLRAGTARALDGNEGVAAVARDLVRAIARHSISDAAENQLTLQHTLVGFLAALLPSGTATTPSGAVHRELARSFIEHHLSDPELSPADIAAACSISVSYLHRLFADDGWTVAGYLRERRLQVAYEQLAAGGSPSEPVAAVGRRCGLVDASHFSRIFKARFDMPPGELRRTSMGSTGSAVQASSTAG